MIIKKIDRVIPLMVKDTDVYALGMCSQEAYKDIGDMLKYNGLENRDVGGTLYYDDYGNWTISLSIKLKEPQ